MVIQLAVRRNRLAGGSAAGRALTARRPRPLRSRRCAPSGRPSEDPEVAGLYFEEFAVGQTIEHAIRRTVTEADNTLFSVMTMNPQPLHLDAEFAAGSEFGQRLVNSLFTLGLMIGLSVGDTTIGTTVANLGMTDVRFPKPVFHGDTLHATTRVLAVRDSKSRPDAGLVELEHSATNQRGEIVAICKRTALMKRRPAAR
jgi:acyl dehydratase